MKVLNRDKIIHRFSRDIPPVIEIDPGEEILFEALDTSNGKVKTVHYSIAGAGADTGGDPGH